MTAVRPAACLALVFLSSHSIQGQAPKLKPVLERVDAYLTEYEQHMSAVVADEYYVQKYGHVLAFREGTATTRTISSDFAFWTVPQDAAWMGFRDTYAVDGAPVRDRDDRLLRILSAPGSSALRQAFRISEGNARYNIGGVPRTINVPTMALGMMHPKNRWRFKTRAAGQESVEGVTLSKIEFREHERPTIIRTYEGAPQPARVFAWVDPGTGAIHRTAIDLDESRASPITTKITVDYAVDAGVGFLVPREMVEAYYHRGDRDTPTFQIVATATYTSYRRFRTSGRVVQ